MKGPPLGPGGEDITWPDQVASRGRKASSTRKMKPQTSNRITEPASWSSSMFVHDFVFLLLPVLCTCQ